MTTFTPITIECPAVCASEYVQRTYTPDGDCYSVLHIDVVHRLGRIETTRRYAFTGEEDCSPRESIPWRSRIRLGGYGKACGGMFEYDPGDLDLLLMYDEACGDDCIPS